MTTKGKKELEKNWFEKLKQDFDNGDITEDDVISKLKELGISIVKKTKKEEKTENKLICIYTEEAEDHLEEFGEDKRKRVYQAIIDLHNKPVWSKIDAGTRFRYCYETLKTKILSLKIDKTLNQEIIELQKKYKNWY
jgi:hypothetical protein